MKARLAVVTLILTVVASRSMNGVASDKPADDKPHFVVDASAFAKEFVDDPKTATAKYKGKTIEVTGLVAGATPHWHPRGFSLKGARKKAKEPWFLSVDCEALPELLDDGWLLARGQKVKVTGTLTSGDKDRIILGKCTFSELEKSPMLLVASKDLAEAYAKDPRAASKKYGDTDKDTLVEGPIKDIVESKDKDLRTIKLEGSGKIGVHCQVRKSDAEGLKKGDTVRIKGMCRMFPDYPDHEYVEMNGSHVVKPKPGR